MKSSLLNEIVGTLTSDLRAFAGICEEILSLGRREYLALSGQTTYEASEFHEKRKTLLPDIELLVRKFRDHRMTWQQIPTAQREHLTEVKSLFHAIQGLMTRVIQLDRENQQAMLKRGLMPVKHLPSTKVQPPHYVTDLYRRNSAV
jgi:hypothetical protein